jgi:aminoglycoside 6-adenylyltransferase
LRTEQNVLRQLQAWAEALENVRAVILTSSRADPHCTPDVLSDYDVEVFVQDTAPFVRDDAWVNAFGAIIVRWPSSPQPTISEGWITQLVLYEDGIRIDFQITSQHPAASPNLDSGYRVLVDKDGIAAQLPAPSYTQYIIERPTVGAFEGRLNAFWWDIVYVAKALWRGELNYAKVMLDGTIRFDKLRPLIEWHIGLRHDWAVNPGIYGRWFHRYLDPSTWQDYERTFADADIESNWRALFATLEFVRKLGKEIADALGFEYPERTDTEVTNYILWIREQLK